MAQPFSVVGLLVREEYVCAVTRRNMPSDLGLPGGKIDPTDASPMAALCRELWEEIGIEVTKAEFVFERTDDDGTDNIAWCYRVTEWIGEPHQRESGIYVLWTHPVRLLEANCTFRKYNLSLFRHIGMVSVPA